MKEVNEMGFLDKVGEGMKEAGTKFKEGVSDLDDKLGDKVDVAKLESQIRDQERDLKDLKVEIGEKVIDSIEKDGSFDVSNIKCLLDKAKDIKSKIADLNAEIEKIKK